MGGGAITIELTLKPRIYEAIAKSLLFSFKKYVKNFGVYSTRYVHDELDSDKTQKNHIYH